MIPSHAPNRIPGTFSSRAVSFSGVKNSSLVQIKIWISHPIPCSPLSAQGCPLALPGPKKKNKTKDIKGGAISFLTMAFVFIFFPSEVLWYSGDISAPDRQPACDPNKLVQTLLLSCQLAPRCQSTSHRRCPQELFSPLLVVPPRGGVAAYKTLMPTLSSQVWEAGRPLSSWPWLVILSSLYLAYEGNDTPFSTNHWCWRETP